MIGKLRHVIEIQEPIRTRNGLGEEVVTYVTVETVWGQVKGLSGTELLSARALVATTSIEVRLRYWEGLTSYHRLKWGTRYLGIDGIVDPEGTKRWMLCRCTESNQQPVTTPVRVTSAIVYRGLDAIRFAFSGPVSAVAAGGNDAGFVYDEGDGLYGGEFDSATQIDPVTVEMHATSYFPAGSFGWKIVALPTLAVGLYAAILVPQSGVTAEPPEA